MGRLIRRLAVLFMVTTGALSSHSGIAASALGFTLVAHADLGARGMNAGFAIAGECAYVGARNDRGVIILEVTDPTAPRPIGELPARPGATPRELRAVAEVDLLAVMSYQLDTFAISPNTIDLFDIADCRAPMLIGRYDFGEAQPHEFFLWRDPAPERAGRILAFVAMWGNAPNLRVIDLTAPTAPVLLATWDAGAALGLPSRLHSITVAPDGRRAYLADWDAGLIVLDTSEVAVARPTPRLASLTAAERVLRLPGGNLHSAVAIPGGELVVTTQEIYGPGTCPYGRLHIVDIADPAIPRVVGAYGTPENDPAACATTEPRDGAFTSHNPLVVANIAFVSWYAGGLRAVDLTDPSTPIEVGNFVPEPLPTVAADDFSLGAYPIRMWSAPVIRDGLLYVVDIRNGLFILRYTGPRAETIAALSLAEGNSV